MRGNRGADTRPEVRLRSALHRRGLRFRKHLAPVRGLRCRPDVVFPGERVVVFLHGCFWHSCPVHGTMPTSNRAYWEAKLRRNVERDAHNAATLAAHGWLVVEAWEHEAVDEVAARVHAVLLARRGEAQPTSGVNGPPPFIGRQVSRPLRPPAPAAPQRGTSAGRRCGRAS